MILKFIRSFLKIAPLIALVLICLQFLVSNELAGVGAAVQDADIRIANLREENEILSQQVASASALATIAAKAQELGFTAKTNYLVIGPEEFALEARR